MNVITYEKYSIENGVIKGLGKTSIKDINQSKSENELYFFLYDLKLVGEVFRNEEECSQEEIEEMFEILSKFNGICGKEPYTYDEWHKAYVLESSTIDPEWIKEESTKFGELLDHFMSMSEQKKYTEQNKEKFVELLNKGMHNIVAKNEINSKTMTMSIEFEPLNLFGVVYLKLRDMFLKDLHYNSCEKCGDKFISKRDSLDMCERCLTSRRQRRKNVKQDYKAGMSIQEIINKRTGSTAEEITEWVEEWERTAQK